MRLIDADAIKLPKGFFEEVDNVPKFYEWLNTLPTIEPKRGRWIRIEDSPEENAQRLHTMRCSNCGEYQTAPYLGTFKVYNFCPNCGKPMEEGFI